ncbi:hypothetical protein [Sphingomonas sp. LHG3406-1]|uniref:hypothetical protein n=1 Tax=Sphingomonas sp. LHG3406-1 TaxID=2804617 RepID=UPI0026344645|nr:hypothetical protein [Sphingomonas sp. LHG3406-1]
MALGALIAAIGEDDEGGLHALAPLAGRTLIEYQARCAAAVGAAPIVVLVERVPPALQTAFERLRTEGIGVVPVSDAMEAAARFDPDLAVLQLADGVAPAPALLADLAEEPARTILTVPDDESHEGFERIDDRNRWAGISVVDSALLKDTARMLGDWDLQSTLLRRAVQSGARLLPATEGLSPFLAGNNVSADAFDRHLLDSSRQRRRDWPSRFILPPLEDVLTRQLMGAPVKPGWLPWAALVMVLAAALLFTRGSATWAMGLLVAASPLDRLAERLATVRLRPLSRHALSLRLLAPAHALALTGLAWFETRHGGGWGALVAAGATVAFAEAKRVERRGRELGPDLWLFSPRSAVFAAIPFAAFGAWSLLIVFLALYATASFFIVQSLVHGPDRD